MSLNDNLQSGTKNLKNFKSEAENLNIPVKKAISSETNIRQNWSLPDSIIYFITKNPSSSKAYQKLLQSCKYFFTKNRIYIISQLYYCIDAWQISCADGARRFHMVNVICKFWITDILYIHSLNEHTLFCSLNTKIYRCDAKHVSLGGLVISYKDFQFLTSSVEEITAHQITVTDKDGSNISIEKFIEALPTVKKILYYSNRTYLSVTTDTVKEIFKIPHFSKLKLLTLNHLPQTFDMDTFYDYIKKHKTSKFSFAFDDSISDAYKARLETIIDEILATKSFDYCAPYISYPGLNEDKSYQLYHIYHRH